MSDEWVPQGTEATKCITLQPAFNTHCAWHVGSTELLIKNLSANWFGEDVSHNKFSYPQDTCKRRINKKPSSL